MNKKQSEETIKKRIKNTDQIAKEITRQNTLILKYGVSNISQLPEIKEKISKAHKGKKIVRTKKHQMKIIETKRKNGTLNHSKETKEKIKNSLLDLYQSNNVPVCISFSPNKKYKHGKYEGFYYRSSYELTFIKYCLNNNILIESAEKSEFRIRYNYLNKDRYYYPDFYLPEYDIIVEIKPLSMLKDDKVISKMDIGAKTYNYMLITEEELCDLKTVFSYLV